MDARDPESSAREASAHRRPHGRATPPDFDAAHFRHALSQFATGVTVVTTRSEGRPGTPAFVGVTENCCDDGELTGDESGRGRISSRC